MKKIAKVKRQTKMRGASSSPKQDKKRPRGFLVEGQRARANQSMLADLPREIVSHETSRRQPAGSNKCSVCSGPRDNKHRAYCLACHAEYMREWRKTHRLSGLALFKARARAYANTYLRRGKLTKQPCVNCGNHKSQMHHPDYSKPLAVLWLCRPCNQKGQKSLPKVLAK